MPAKVVHLDELERIPGPATLTWLPVRATLGLRAFGCNAYDGLKVLIHATSHDEDRSKSLGAFSRLFETVSVDATAFLMSAWRGEVNLLELAKPEYLPFQQDSRRTPSQVANERNPVVEQAIEALARIGARKAS